MSNATRNIKLAFRQLLLSVTSYQFESVSGKMENVPPVVFELIVGSLAENDEGTLTLSVCSYGV